jgi:L-iditol 2-dehydrogenase
MPQTMKVARYLGKGEIGIVEEPVPSRPPGGLLVRTEACGLCSGELMEWYMDRKVPHVLGHEVAGQVVESEDERFPVGSRVFPHHHAPCLSCDMCESGHHVHCEQWRATKLQPGGMAEWFAVPAENLNDTIRVDDMRPVDAALIEPLACVMKSLRMADLPLVPTEDSPSTAVIGLGVMGLMHLLMVDGAVGYDLKESRLEWARAQGLDARAPIEYEQSEIVFVCPGSQAAFEFALEFVLPGGTIVMFAPLPPGEPLRVPGEAYFRDIKIAHSYSCGPLDTQAAVEAIEQGYLWAEQVVSDFIPMSELPSAYAAMKRADILKPMVVF